MRYTFQRVWQEPVCLWQQVPRTPARLIHSNSGWLGMHRETLDPAVQKVCLMHW